MDIIEINKMIDELEHTDVSFSSVRNLASLYIVRGHLEKKLDTVLTRSNNNVLRELYDVIPSYENYVKVKRKYQLNEIPDTKMLEELQNLCKEIKEFIHALYVSTYNKEERQILKNLISDIEKTL